jgi:hypothetical protein
MLVGRGSLHAELARDLLQEAWLAQDDVYIALVQSDVIAADAARFRRSVAFR